MTTITFKEDLKLMKTDYNSAIDFLSFFDINTLYEEYLERKMQNAQNAPERDFINL